MDKRILLHKKIGETPLQLLNQFKKLNPLYRDVKMAYAGRLDPMAKGLMLYLVGEECKERDKYQNLNKSYQFDLIYGFRTDTYDALGIADKVISSDLDSSSVPILLKELIGISKQPYPPYSSKTIEGIPMFKLAREDKLMGKVIPAKEINIKSASVLKYDQIKHSDLLTTIAQQIQLVKGDFRQSSITERWIKLLSDSQAPIHKFNIEIELSSGGYVRGLADMIGKKLGGGAFAMDINRLTIGNYSVKDIYKSL